MFIGLSDRVAPILAKLRIFINEIVIPNEDRYLEELSHNRWQQPAIMQSMKCSATSIGCNRETCR